MRHPGRILPDTMRTHTGIGVFKSYPDTVTIHLNLDDRYQGHGGGEKLEHSYAEELSAYLLVTCPVNKIRISSTES